MKSVLLNRRQTSNPFWGWGKVCEGHIAHILVLKGTRKIVFRFLKLVQILHKLFLSSFAAIKYILTSFAMALRTILPLKKRCNCFCVNDASQHYKRTSIIFSPESFWYGRRESNPRHKLGKLVSCH